LRVVIVLERTATFVTNLVDSVLSVARRTSTDGKNAISITTAGSRSRACGTRGSGWVVERAGSTVVADAINRVESVALGTTTDSKNVTVHVVLAAGSTCGTVHTLGNRRIVVLNLVSACVTDPIHRIECVPASATTD
jgi:hypothetical protein